MKNIKFTSKTTFQTRVNKEYKPNKYKGYEVGSLPSKFAFIYNELDEVDGIKSWFNYKGLTYIAQ
jgi:hypothetical protein